MFNTSKDTLSDILFFCRKNGSTFASRSVQNMRKIFIYLRLLRKYSFVVERQKFFGFQLLPFAHLLIFTS